ncbi:hypothetical protein IFM89_015973 [Coptis chinensis]|uniref:DUF4283 domain-containing protein n=1 Tax=Coptis chinensis TaxID=261450 RepID=A0A835LRD5_9MAGN|nr:hypothetical protein IFM89_015973 [Coptis chinensis]
MDFKNVPKGSVGAMSALVKVGIIGGIGLYATSNSLYNVQGGCRAIVFNRLVGVKERYLNIGTRVAVLDLNYPWRLLACSECKQFGHKETTCPQKSATQGKSTAQNAHNFSWS